MYYEEALEWLSGVRSMMNMVPCDPIETWQVRIAQADAARVQQAYWVAKAHDDAPPLRELSDEEIEAVYEQAVNAWNDQADDWNKWRELPWSEQAPLFARALLAAAREKK